MRSSLNSTFIRDPGEPDHSFLYRHFSFNISVPSASALAPSSCSPQSFSLAMAASHPHLFQPSVSDENEISKLVMSHYLPLCVVL
jgi:hypothetical protein